MSQWIDLLDRVNIKPIPNLAGTAEPQASDDSDDGYGIGSTWVWGNRSWICTDATVANAVWVETTSTAGVHGLDEHTDVDTTTVPPTDGQALVWDDGAGKWEPGSVAAGGGGGAGDMDCVEAGFLTEGGSAWWEVPTTDTWTDAPLDVTEIETDSAVLDHDGTTNTGRITIKESGYYLVYYTCGMNNHYGIGLRIQKNGATTIPTSESPNNQNLGNDKDAGMISWQGVHYFDASGTDPYIYLQCWWPSEQTQQSAIDAGQVSLGAIRLATSAATTLDALTDTDLTGVTNQDVLAYNSTSSKWEPTSATAPGAHATTHLSGNSDELNHDGLLNYVANEHIDWTGASAGTIDPTNVPVVTASADGLAPTYPDNTVDYLRADGTWQTPPGGSASTLDDVVTGGTPDNDVTVPVGDPIILRDGASAISALTVAQTTVTQDIPAIAVSTVTIDEGVEVAHTSGSKTTVVGEGITFDGDTSNPGYSIVQRAPTVADADGSTLTVGGGPANGTGDGADLVLQGGQAPGAGASGDVNVGPSNTYTAAVNIGAADVPSNVVGDLDVGGDITVTGTVDGVNVADHSALHGNGGADEISVAALSGQLADPQLSSIEDGGNPEGTAHTINFGSNLTASVAAGVATITSVGGADATAIHDDASQEIYDITADTSPALDDVVIIESAANSWAKRSVAIDDLPGKDLEIQDEGVPVATQAGQINFVGAGVQVDTPTPLAFWSDWRTATGTNWATAVSDNGKWTGQSYGGGIEVVAASGLGFPAGMTNVLRTPDNGFTGGDVCAWDEWAMPAVGEAVAFRNYMRHDINNPGGDLNNGSNHNIQPGVGDISFSWSWKWGVRANDDLYDLAFTCINSGINLPMSMSDQPQGTVLVLEHSFERVTSTTWRVRAQVYDSTYTTLLASGDTITADGTDFHSLLQNSPSGGSTAPARSLFVGWSGGAGWGSITGYNYFGGSAVAITDPGVWIGKYPAAEEGGGGTGEIVVTIPGGTAPVTEVFGRTGSIIPWPNDYDASEVNDDSGVGGATVAASLDLLDTASATALHTDGNAEISGITVQKGSPIGVDWLIIEDSVTGDTQKAQITDLPVVAGGAERLVLDARASATTVAIGEVAYITGWNGTEGVVTVGQAQADSASSMPAYGIARSAISVGSTGQIVAVGTVTGMDTSAWAVGDELYVSDTVAGGLTNARPDGTAIVQKIGTVNKVDAATGEIQVSGGGLPNSLPNLAQNNMWIGDANGLPTATAFDPDITTLTLPASTAISDFGKTLIGQPDEAFARTTMGAAWEQTTITGTGSLTGGGNLSADRTIDLGDNGVTNVKILDATIVATDKLSATGTPDANNYLCGDNTWKTPAGAGDVSATGTPLVTEYARWTDATTIEGRTPAEVLSDIGADAAGTARPPTSHAYDSHTGTVPIADIAGTPTGTGDIVLESSPTIVTPTVASFANATHDHADAAGGGTIAYADITGTPTVPTLTKSITVEDPTTSEDITMFYTPVAITIQEIRAVTLGATTTINFDLYEHAFASRASAGTAVNGSSITADTDGVVDSSFTNAGIAADSWVVLQTTTGGSGSPTELCISVEYTED